MIYLNFRSGSAAFDPYNDMLHSITEPFDLIDDSGQGTDWSVAYLLGSESTSEASGLGPYPTTGAASWITNQNAATSGHMTNGDAWSILRFQGPPNRNISLEMYSGGPEGRITEWRVNDQLQTLANDAGDVTAVFDTTTDTNGQLLVEFRRVGSSTAYATVLRFLETDPVLTATQPPQGGEIFSFSGSNYSAQPTGPMTFTQGTRVISRAVTISNWNAEDGSFTGVTDTALPSVPADGASDTPALLYGEPVTISLPDPGA